MLKALFSSPKIIENASKAADALVFSEQEKAKFLVQAMSNTLPMSLSRRILAFGITGVWAFMVILWCMMIVVGWDNKATLIYQGIKDLITNPFNIIVGFYFLKSLTDQFKK